MATSRRARVALRGIGTATLVAVASIAGTGTAAAAPGAIDCTWAATASRLLANLERQNDPSAEGIRTALLQLGFGPAGQLPANCAGTGAGNAGATSAEPLNGAAEMGIFTDSGSTGKTITVAAGQSIGDADASPGDTVEIAAGTYEGFKPKSGSNGAYVTYKAADDAKVVISGQGGGGQGAISLDDVSYVHLQNLTVQDASSFGIYGNKPDHVALTGIEVAGSGDGGLVILGGSNIYVEGCNIHGTNQKDDANHEGLTIGEGTKTFEVFNCKVHDNGEEGIDAKYETTDGMVHNNAVWANGGPNIYVDAAQDVQIRNNWSWGAKKQSKAGIAMAVEDYSTSKSIADIQITGNTVWDNAGGNVTCWDPVGGSWSGIVVQDNALVGDDQPKGCGGEVEASGNSSGEKPTESLISSLIGDIGSVVGSNESGSAAAGSGDRSSDEEN